MNRSALAGLLALQILIVGGVFAWNMQAPEQPEEFFSFVPDSITEFTVRTDDETVVVRRVEESWQLGDGKPADGDKVGRVLDKLADAYAGWPVATSASTADRFEVTQGTFQKQLTLRADEEVLADVYFGTSPGFRKVHVAAADGGPVYAIEFSNYELGNDAAAWLDKNLLRPVGELTGLRRDGQFDLTLTEELWVDALGADLDEDKVEQLLNRFRNLSVYKIHDGEVPPTPTAQLVWEDSEGTANLTLYHVVEGEDEDGSEEWIAKSDRVAGHYGVSTYIAEEMAWNVDELVKQSTEEDEESDEATMESTSDE